MLYIGIDCGLTGAVAIVDGDVVQRGISIYPIPTHALGGKTKSGKPSKRRDYDLPGMAGLLLAYRQDAHVFLEKQQAMPTVDGRQKTGMAACFSLGKGYGIWLGIITALQIPMTLVHPTTWKAALLRDMRTKDKEASRVRACELFPALADQFTTKASHNAAEALLLAEYGRRQARAREAFAERTPL